MARPLTSSAARAATPSRSRTSSNGRASRSRSGSGRGYDASSEPDVVGRRYKLDVKIGSGGFGRVYSGRSIVSGRRVAVKMERDQKGRSSLLDREKRIYTALKDCPGFPRISWYGVFDGERTMVMELLGKPLTDLLPMRTADVAAVAAQLMERLRDLHAAGYLHRDIKPSNLMTSAEDRGRSFSTVYMIDMGLATSYLSRGDGIRGEEREHVPPSKEGFSGTHKYASIHAHRGRRQSRRDDLESAGYCVLQMMGVRLPWRSLPRETPHREYVRMKRDLSFLQDAPVEMASYFRYTRALRYEETPDYDYLITLFQGLRQRKIDERS